MKIGISATLVDGGRSGIGHYVGRLMPALLRACPEHEYVVYALPRDAALFESPGAQIVPVEAIVSRESDLWWHHVVLPRLAQEHRLDVLHVPTQRRALWQRPCALVTTVHDPGAIRTPRDAASRGSCPGAVFRALLRRQDAIVTATRAAAAAVQAIAGLPTGRVTAIACGVDATRFRPRQRDEALASVLRRAVHPPFFLMVGRLDQAAHNQGRLIEAFNRFKTATPSPWQLVLLGPDGCGAGEIRRSALRSPYAQDIHCLGFVEPAELPEWYRAAGAVVSTRLRHGFAFSLLEALASGCPILTTDSPITRELCGEAALYFDATDVAAVQAHLTTLAHDTALRQRLGAAAVARVQGASWAHTATQTLAVYHHARVRYGAGSRTRNAADAAGVNVP